jgi:transposase
MTQCNQKPVNHGVPMRQSGKVAERVKQATSTYGAYIGLDVHKDTITVAIAQCGRGQPECHGQIANTPEAVGKLIDRFSAKYGGEQLLFVYEAGPCGYGIYRQILACGHACEVVAPSMIPRKAGERVKTDRRDALGLARLSRAGELTAVWVPGREQEAIRDLTRAREDMKAMETRARQLMAYLGLVPSEHSSGPNRRQGGITKTGNGHVRRVLVEAAWNYRFPARKTRVIERRAEKTSASVQAIAWAGQKRLCGRYRRLIEAGKGQKQVTTAVARELAGFIWAIACEVMNKPHASRATT